MCPTPLQESVLLLIAFMLCVGMHSTTVWLGDDPYLFLHCCSIINCYFIFHTEEEISGLCFLELSKEDWNDYRLSGAGVIVINKLQEKIKAKQTAITTNPSPHVPGMTLSHVERLH